MTAPTTVARTGSPVLVAVYAALSVIGLIGTWYFNLSFFATGGTDYLPGRPASNSHEIIGQCLGLGRS